MKKEYRHVISLGFCCDVAQELERYGLRDASFPLDWVISPIGSVIDLIDARFDGFISRLERRDDLPYIVRNAHGVEFFHDFTPGDTIDAQIHSVKAKYDRRIERLFNTDGPTLFVRYVQDVDELERVDELLSALRRLNDANDLLLIGNASIQTDRPIFLVDPDADDRGVCSRPASANADLRRELIRLRYPLLQRVRNLWRYWSRYPRRLKPAVRCIISRWLGEGRLRRILATIRR